MRRPLVPIVTLGCLLSVGFATSDGGDDLEHNRRLLEKRKADPEHYQRLKRDLAAFYALPPERQEQIRDLDRQLHQADPDEQARLWAVMERYSLWLERLHEPERKAVREAKNKIAVIRGLREKEWIERLPRAIRDELYRLPTKEQRYTRMQQLREQEQQQRVVWQRALGGANGPIPRPKKASELTPEAQTFLEKNILPRTNDLDRKALKQAEGHWPEYPRYVAWLADRYPVLPELPQGKIVNAAQLPANVRERLDRNLAKPFVARQEGKWPDYALAVSGALRFEQGLPPLGASRPNEFPPAIKEFLEKKLLPALPMTALADLEKCEGRWPDYPRRLLTLARRHQLEIPEMSLPGPEVWEAARVARHDHGDDVLEAIAADPKFGKSGGMDWFKLGNLGKKPGGGGGKFGWPDGRRGHR